MIVTIGGFMATGKSTVGRELADRLGWPFFDLDVFVEKRCIDVYGKGITELIEKGDESLFRQQERILVKEIGTFAQPAIVSLGGGTLHNEDLGKWLVQHTVLFVLQASWRTVEKRIYDSQRPLKHHAKTLFELRKDGYKRGNQVNVDTLAITEVVDALEIRINESL
jgi:shikimate kinase